jgi:hypothetical protein
MAYTLPTNRLKEHNKILKDMLNKVLTLSKELDKSIIELKAYNKKLKEIK